jgi:hypothetical protein
MALGIVAAVAGVMKLRYTKTFVFGGDTLHQTTPLYVWFRLEEIVLIAAACAPFLKTPIEHTLRRLSVPQFQFKSLRLKTISSSQGDLVKEIQQLIV